MPRATSTAMDAGILPPARPDSEQPLAHAPLLKGVQLDRQTFSGILGSLAHADAEPLAQEGPDRVLGEAYQQVDLDGIGGRIGQRIQEEKWSREAIVGHGPSTIESDRVEVPRPLRHQFSDGEVANVERLKRMMAHDELTSALTVTIPVCGDA